MYRNYEEGLQRQVERLGTGKTVDGLVNFIVSVKDQKEYEYFEWVNAQWIIATSRYTITTTKDYHKLGLAIIIMPHVDKI